MISRIPRDSDYFEGPETSSEGEVTEISSFSCFQGSLTELNLLASIHLLKIGHHAFSHCYNLTKVKLPQSLEVICQGGFYMCINLKKVDLSDHSRLRVIAHSAFFYCFNLSSLKFPSTLESIGNYAFYECNHLDSTIDLSHTCVKSIGNQAFGRSKVEKFLLPKTFLKFQKETFYSLGFKVYSLREVRVDKDNKFIQNDSCGMLNSLRGVLLAGTERKETYQDSYHNVNQTVQNTRFMIRRGTTRILSHCFEELLLVNITIPASVIEIGDNAFYDCRYLSRVQFGKDSRLETIHSWAFCGCRSIASIYLPPSVKYIGISAFQLCNNLKKFNIPLNSQLEEIGHSAFFVTKITNLNLPKTLKRIGSFLGGMNELVNVKLNNDLFISNDCVIYSKDMTELISMCSNKTEFEIPKTVRIIKKGAFMHSHITSLDIPESVEIIDQSAFEVSNLRTIRFAENSNLKQICSHAFYGTEVVSMIFPRSLQSLDLNSLNSNVKQLKIMNENFFTDSRGIVYSRNPNGIVFVPRRLTSISIDPNLEVIYGGAFIGSQITSLSLPQTLKRIGEYAFFKSKIEHIHFHPECELIEIQSRAFFETKLKVVELPRVTENFGSNIFAYCALDTLIYPSNFNPKNIEMLLRTEYYTCKKVVIPFSSLNRLARMDFSKGEINILMDQ